MIIPDSKHKRGRLMDFGEDGLSSLRALHGIMIAVVLVGVEGCWESMELAWHSWA
jgi:hypothetical protein